MAIENILRKTVLQMSAYPLVDATGLIKLDAMENLYPLPETIKTLLASHLATVPLNFYPTYPTLLAEKITKQLRLPSHLRILFGNGSDELISMIAVACATEKAKLMAPVPTFSMYEMSARFAGIPFIGVDLQADFQLDLPVFLEKITQAQPTIIYLSFPNNPTGTLFSKAQIRTIIQYAHNALVVIDEAYQPFAQDTCLSILDEFENVVLLRTFSKLGWAGIRLGYLIGSSIWIAQLDKVRPPYNVNALTQATATFLFDYLPVFEQQAQQICVERQQMLTALQAQPGLTVFPSSGNFLLVRVPQADEMFDAIYQSGILVKDVSRVHPLLKNCLRLTIGQPEHNRQLLTAMQQACTLNSAL